MIRTKTTIAAAVVVAVVYHDMALVVGGMEAIPKCKDNFPIILTLFMISNGKGREKGWRRAKERDQEILRNPFPPKM